MRPVAVLALAVLASLATGALASPARAGEVTLPNTSAVLVVPDAWTAHDLPGLVAGYRAPGGAALAVTRAQVPNPDAYRAKTRDAYVDQIERGFLGALPKARRTARRVSDVGGVPTLDLEARRGDGITVVVRILLYRTYALAVAIEVPAGTSPREARAIAQQFAPRLP